MERVCRLHPSGKCSVHILPQDGEHRKLSCECQHRAHMQDILLDLSVKLQPVVPLTLWLKSKSRELYLNCIFCHQVCTSNRVWSLSFRDLVKPLSAAGAPHFHWCLHRQTWGKTQSKSRDHHDLCDQITHTETNPAR